jgi:hypothetical protein
MTDSTQDRIKATEAAIERNSEKPAEKQDTAVPEAAPEAEPAPTQKTTEPEADSADGDNAPDAQDEDDDKQPLPKGLQRKINRLTRKAKDAERTARERELELQLAQERLKHYEPKQPPQAKREQVREKPTLEQFDFDAQAHAEAVAEWMFEQKMTERDRQAAEAKRREQFQTLMQSIAEQEAAFAADHPDYDDVAKDPTLPISEVMAEAMHDSDSAPAIAYYLGQHREEAAAIAQMSPAAAGRAIGRIEAKLSVAKPPSPPRTVSSAPAIAPTVQGAAVAAKDTAAMSVNDHLAAIRANRNR